MEEKKSKARYLIVIIITAIFVTVGVGLFFGFRYVSESMLQSNEHVAIDIALMVKNNFKITDAEVKYMKTLTFNEMEVSDINRRLMDVGDGVVLESEIKNVYLLSALSKDEIKYTTDEKTSEFFDTEVGTPLNGIWLLNGKIDDAGKFVVAQREDIYRYTNLDEETMDRINKKEAYGELSQDGWGEFVTGYAPVYTVEGHYVGMLGIDMDPDQYQTSVFHMALFVLVALAVVIIVMTFVFLRFYRRHINERESIHQKEQEKFQAQIAAMSKVDEKNLIAKGRHNITKNEISFYLSHKDGALTLTEGGSYDDAVEMLAERAYDEEKAKEIRDKMSSQAIIESYENGETEGYVEYRRKMPEDNIAWVRMQYTMFQDPSTSDINIFIYSYNIDERVKDHEIIDKLSSFDCEALGIIDARTHQYELKDVMRELEGPEVIGKGDFDERARTRLPLILLPEEKDEIITQFQVDYIKEQLETTSWFQIFYAVRDNDGNTQRKRCRFCYLDDTKRQIMYYRSDVTAVYDKEQKYMKELQEALDTAKRANETKTEFFARMSHDMRTPMNGILGLLELSEGEQDIEALQSNMDKMKSSGEYLLGLINDSLDFQKIESGKLVLKPEIVNGKKLFDNMQSMIYETAVQKNITLQVDFNQVELDTFIRIDVMRFKQILVNLLSNAVKFTMEGGKITVKLQRLRKKGNIVRNRITIADSGIGMSEDFIKNGLFKPFAQESNRITADYAGTGLGLSIAKRLTELMGGTISVKSKKNVGAQFDVEIDFEVVESQEAASFDANSKKVQNILGHQLEGKRILLAEDHPLNAEIMERLLEKVGCSVVWTKDGAECVKTFADARNHFDAVLMDIRMPVMDGLEAASSIRKMERGDAKDIPIIAVTANAYEEDVRKAFDAGMNGHIAKPVDLKRLYEELVRHIG